MVIETPNGWHIPVVGLSGVIKKMMFYDRDVEPTKQIIEIQGSDHYVIGAGCSIWNSKKVNVDFMRTKVVTIYGTLRAWTLTSFLIISVGH